MGDNRYEIWKQAPQGSKILVATFLAKSTEDEVTVLAKALRNYRWLSHRYPSYDWHLYKCEEITFVQINVNPLINKEKKPNGTYHYYYL